MATPALQQDPSKSFGTTDYFDNKDQQRQEVNKLRKEERNKRIIQQGLTKNIKKAVRAGKDPSSFVAAAKAMNLTPLGGGGIGPEAGQQEAVLRARAVRMFEETKKASDIADETMGAAPAAAAASGKTGASALPSATTPPTPLSAPATTTSAALPALGMDTATGDYQSELGKQASKAYVASKDNNEFRQGLARAIDRAKTPQEINELRDVASKNGITTEAFNSRVPNALRTDLPEWANEVQSDSTFKGQDLARFAGKTRAEAFDQVMKERSAGFMDSANQAGVDLYKAEQAPIIAEQQRIKNQQEKLAADFMALPVYDQVKQINVSKTNELLKSITSTDPASVRKQVNEILGGTSSTSSPEDVSSLVSRQNEAIQSDPLLAYKNTIDPFNYISARAKEQMDTQKKQKELQAQRDYEENTQAASLAGAISLY